METTITPTRTLVARLAQLGIDPPPALADALALVDEAQACTGPEPVDLSAAALTVEAGQVAALLDRAVDARIQRDTLGPLRAELLDRLTRRAIRAVDAAALDICAAVAPIFTDAAAEFTDTYRNLPAGWQDAQHLVSAGPAAVEAFQQAQHHAGTLDVCRAIKKALPSLEPRSPIARGTEFCTVTDTVEAERLVKVDDSGLLGYFGALLAHDGVTGLKFWATPQDHHAYLEQLPKMRLEHRQTGRGAYEAVASKVPA